MKVLKTGTLGKRSEYSQKVSCARCGALYEFTADDVETTGGYGDDNLHPCQQSPAKTFVTCPECACVVDVHLPDFKPEES